MAKEFAVYKVFRNCPTVYPNIGSSSSPGHGMNNIGNHLFAYTGLTQKENGAIERGDLPDHIHDTS